MKKSESFARRITGRILLWMIFVLLGISSLLFYSEVHAIREFYAEIYRNKMLITNEYTRRVTSDVYVAVTNNIFYLEQTLDKPELHKATMERIVKSGTRVRSCGISFVEDYYYPQKEHHFCPFAWRNTAKPDVIYSQDMGDADLDYLNADWFLDILNGDSAKWSEPFYDGYDNKTALSAYMVPIHDQQGRVVAVLGADISLDWLTNKLVEADSTINKSTMMMASRFKMKSITFIINHDGAYLTHSDENSIIKGNLYSQIEPCDGSDVEKLVADMRAGVEQDARNDTRFVVNGEECYLFYTPIKYTKWLMVSVVPCRPIDILGYLNAGTVLFVVLLAMLLLAVVAYYYMKNAIRPLNQLTQMTDDITKGKYDTPVPETSHDDEIGRLRDSIEEMQFTLSSRADAEKR